MGLPPVGVGERDGRNVAASRRRQERGDSRGGRELGIGGGQLGKGSVGFAGKRRRQRCRRDRGLGISGRRKKGRSSLPGKGDDWAQPGGGGGVRGGAAERHRADRRGADRGPREQRGTAGAQRARTGGPKSMQDNRRGRPQSEGGASQSGHRKEGCRGWRVTQTGGRGAARAEPERTQTGGRDAARAGAGKRPNGRRE